MKSLIISVALAAASIGSFAAEYTNFDIPAGNGMTRAEVRAQAAMRVLGRGVIFSEATTFVDLPSPRADATRVLARSMM